MRACPCQPTRTARRELRPPARHAVILPVILILVSLLALTMAGFVFFVKSEAEGIRAFTDTQQARLAAESGFEEVVAMLRKDLHNPAAWYDNPTKFRHALVWGEQFEREKDPVREMGSRKDYLERTKTPPPAWRFSVVAARYDGPENTMRFGLTPESAKVDLNHASDEQLTSLLTPLLTDLQIENAPELIAGILDWRDADQETRDGGAENTYYNTLKPAYNAKNGPFDSVEELLLVRGITAAVLYGEDVNRNGILDRNEDDGPDSFPEYDNGDGVLNFGIAPFLTVWAREMDVSKDNKQRISLYNDAATITAMLNEYDGPKEGEEQTAENAIPLSAGTSTFLGTVAGQQTLLAAMKSLADLLPDPEGAAPEAADPNDPNAVAAAAALAALAASPVTPEELGYIMDRLTLRKQELAKEPIFGLININAAPLRVLRTIPGMTEEAAVALVAGRKEVAPELLGNPAWPVIAETIDRATYKRIAPYITTKAYQFHVEIVGYADHLKLAQRLEWIIEMVGPLAQVKYHRDLTRLGVGWPLDIESVIVQSE
jgi:DNA uptake protein ComE-like DNA-binding protein